MHAIYRGGVAGPAGPAKAGVTGNPIRAYTDPGGSDPLAKSIRRIIFTSGSDPPPDQFY